MGKLRAVRRRPERKQRLCSLADTDVEAGIPCRQDKWGLGQCVAVPVAVVASVSPSKPFSVHASTVYATGARRRSQAKMGQIDQVRSDQRQIVAGRVARLS